MKAEPCPICGAPASSRTIQVRSKKQMTMWHCAHCAFDFFAHDPTPALAADKLDESRLKAAGLDIPPVDKDFANGLRQSQPYIDEYLDASDRGRNVLEIGCSWGYFLKMTRDAGARPHGVELNTVRSDYVNAQVGIPCDPTLEGCEARGIRFKKIFMFYVLEYVPQPVGYLQRLADMLDDDGEIIVVTPNVIDGLKDIWHNEAFGNFFYDEHAINYLSPRSVDRMLERLKGVSASTATRQGYSIVNHISWFLTNAPRTTGVVGGDNFIRDIAERLNSGPSVAPAAAGAEIDLGKAGHHLAGMIQEFDASYRKYLEKHRLGNQIRFTVSK